MIGLSRRSSSSQPLNTHLNKFWLTRILSTFSDDLLDPLPTTLSCRRFSLICTPLENSSFSTSFSPPKSKSSDLYSCNAGFSNFLVWLRGTSLLRRPDEGLPIGLLVFPSGRLALDDPPMKSLDRPEAVSGPPVELPVAFFCGEGLSFNPNQSEGWPTLDVLGALAGGFGLEAAVTVSSRPKMLAIFLEWSSLTPLVGLLWRKFEINLYFWT